MVSKWTTPMPSSPSFPLIGWHIVSYLFWISGLMSFLAPSNIFDFGEEYQRRPIYFLDPSRPWENMVPCPSPFTWKTPWIPLFILFRSALMVYCPSHRCVINIPYSITTHIQLVWIAWQYTIEWLILLLMSVLHFIRGGIVEPKWANATKCPSRSLCVYVMCYYMLIEGLSGATKQWYIWDEMHSSSKQNASDTWDVESGKLMRTSFVLCSCE